MLNFTPKKIKFRDMITKSSNPTKDIAHGKNITNVDTAHQVIQGRLKQHSIAAGGIKGSGEHIRKMTQSLAKAEVRHGGEDEKYASATAAHSYNISLAADRAAQLKSKLQNAHNTVMAHAFTPHQNPHTAEPNLPPPPVTNPNPNSSTRRSKFSQFFNRH